MKNQNERNRLLDEIREMERGSVNYFDAKDEFFVIDSENLSDVRPRLYGYSIQESGIYENANLTEGLWDRKAMDGLDGRGCYVYIDVYGGKITIRQDFNGCYGIYLFRHGDYFALSNSFFRLLEHVSPSYPLTLNRDYANQILTLGLASHSCEETPVNEISLTDRNAVFKIDVLTKHLAIRFEDYAEASLSLDSEEGIAALDRWFTFWTNTIRKLKSKTDFITADLSGGYDSRLTFLLLLCSGIDLNKIQIRSFTDKLHTHAEDYKIASQIAEHYGFILNRPLPPNQQLNYSLADAMNIECYMKLAFHKEPYISYAKSADKVFRIGGTGGEAVRNRYTVTGPQFIEDNAGLAASSSRAYSAELVQEIYSSIKGILERSYQYIHEKYGIDDLNSSDYPQYLYREARNRNHFGKSSVNSYFHNRLALSPLMDPNLWKLRLNTPDCPDNNLLMAMIYARYCPELLDFPFEGNHYQLSPDTVDFARRLNARFPAYHVQEQQSAGNAETTPFHVETKDARLERFLLRGVNNQPVANGIGKDFLKAVFDSSALKGFFTAYFDDQIYDHANHFYAAKKYFPIRHCYSVIGIAAVLRFVAGMSGTLSPYQILRRFLENSAYAPYDYGGIVRRFENFLTARVGIKLLDTNGADFQVISCSDSRARILKPDWYQQDGIGYVFFSFFGELEIRLKSDSDGEVRIALLGKDVRRPDDNSKRTPYWIDYTEFSINGKTVFDDLHPTWHNKPYLHTFHVKAGEEIVVNVHWLPHRSDD